MVEKFNSPEEVNPILSAVQLELLAAILEPEHGTYPWEPSDPESEAYFVELEQNFGLEDWSEAEIEMRSQAFYSQVDQLWSSITPRLADQASGSNLQSNLQQRFADFVPQAWLNAIACKSYQVLPTHQSMAEQLVQCIQELLPTWATDDLLVLARPFAYTMRGTEAIESVLNHLRSQDWASLSEIEQARAGLAIAHYALTELHNQQC